jgi:hypothetical protein
MNNHLRSFFLQMGNVIGVAVSKLDAKYMFDNYGDIPENTNFDIKSSVVRSVLGSSEIEIPSENRIEITKSELSEKIASGTYYIPCLMTAAQIAETKTKKVLFGNLN